MNELVSTASLPALFTHNTPLLDVRAPVEFDRGAFPTAVNLPLLTDAERDTIGKTYKALGQQAAVAQGHELVAGSVKAERIAGWLKFIAEHPNAVLYCFRGGLRSETVQNWLAEAGVYIPRVAGGYKRMRRELIAAIDNTAQTTDMLIVAGKTGSGKTHLINALQHSVDLEGIANHRGSAFGPRVSPQPTQINFENALGIALLSLQLPVNKTRRLFLEDESRAIGSLSLPQTLYEKMLASPIALLEESLEQRVNTILNDYIISNYNDFKSAEPENCARLFADYLQASLMKIRRRLGDINFKRLHLLMSEAILATESNPEMHKKWIETLLVEYYDPMYEYQLSKKSSRVVFRGDHDELLRWAAHLDLPLTPAIA